MNTSVQIPLADPEAEAAVLSALMLAPERLPAVREILSGEHFYADANRRVYETIVSLADAGRAIDTVSVAGHLRDRGRLDQVGGIPYLAQLVDATPAVAHVVDHARSIREKWRLRALADVCRTTTAEVHGAGDVERILAAHTRGIDALRPKREEKIELLGGSEIFAPLGPIPYLLEVLDICPGAPTLFAGLGFSAKTLLAHALGLAVACGAPTWGAYPVQPGRVVFLDFEQGQYLTRRRIQRMARGMGLVPDGDDLRLASMPPMYLDDGAAESELRTLCQDVSLLVVDSLSASCPSLDENAASARRVLDMLGRVSEATGCVVVVIHHARKPSAQAEGGARAAIRGSGALFDACGSVVCFERQSDGTIRLTHEKARMSGKLAEPIHVSIIDTDGGGLAVEAREAPPPVPKADQEAARAEESAARSKAQVERVAEQLFEILAAHPGLSGRQWEDLAKAKTGTGTRTVRPAMAALIAEGRVVTTPGPNRSSLHSVARGAS